MGSVAEHHRRDLRRLLRRLPDDLSRVSSREWQDLAAAMDRRRHEALALLPPIRRTLRSVPAVPVPLPVPLPLSVSPAVPPDITPVHPPPVMPTRPTPGAGGAENPA
jgi:hypothetical protein